MAGFFCAQKHWEKRPLNSDPSERERRQSVQLAASSEQLPQPTTAAHYTEASDKVDRAAAQRLDYRIRLMVTSIGDSISKLYELVERAKEGNIHVALGYPSSKSYLASLKIDIRLDRDQRRELVGWLSGEGMTQREIAGVVGVGVGTVNRDLEAGVPNGTPVEVELAVDDDEMSDAEFEVVLHDAREARAEGMPPAVSKGLDGKTYSRETAPSAPRRRPITDVARNLANDMRKLAARIDRFTDDDRLSRNREEISRLTRPYDEALIGAMDRLSNSLGQGGAQ